MTLMGYKETSKFMSLILRHKPEAIGISLDEHGWADVNQLIAGIAKTHEFNMDILEEIVRTDEKQRYSFNEDNVEEWSMAYERSAGGVFGEGVTWFHIR